MKKRTYLVFLAFVGMLFVLTLAARQQHTPSPAQAERARSNSSEVTFQQDVPYGSANGAELRLDVYQPVQHASDARGPAVVLIHGGGWTSFDKSTMRGMGEFLARSGFVGFSVDYRLFQGAENRWPAQLDDVQRSIRWIRAHASKYGVNPERIGAFGHSAGAQLAALLGMEDTHDNSDPALAKYSSRVEAVVNVSGPTDFTTGRDSDGDAFLASFLGVSFQKDPGTWRSASPAFHVAKDDAPFLIVHGTEDQNVPMAQAQELYDKLQSAGVPVTFVKVDDAHTFHTPAARARLAMETLSFFNRYLATAR